MKKFLIILSVLIIGILSCSILTANSSAPLPKDSKIDKIEVFKSKREMKVYQNGKLLKTYKIALGTNPTGAKQFEGDGKTPEGLYYIDGKNPNSSYHKNLGVSYPNETDKVFAKKNKKSPGGLIKIHGLPNGMGAIGSAHTLSDWTLGCIAVTSEEIDELYVSVPLRTPIQIHP